MGFKYRATVLSEIARHGIKPSDDTPPELIHAFINDLYLFEIRSLRTKMLAGLIQKSDYAGQVNELRQRYPILSLPVRFWLDSE